GATQDFSMHLLADESIEGGGITFVFGNGKWYDCGHARHA
ncbi:unnamed protein product, partial [marine sediment metagenome]